MMVSCKRPMCHSLGLTYLERYTVAWVTTLTINKICSVSLISDRQCQQQQADAEMFLKGTLHRTGLFPGPKEKPFKSQRLYHTRSMPLAMPFWKISDLTVQAFPRSMLEKLALFCSCLKTKEKKIFPLRSSTHTVWKYNLPRKNNSSKAIRQTVAKCSLAKLLKFAAADFAENSISPEQAAASSCVSAAKVFLQMQIPLSASASKAHKEFLVSPQALAGWEKWHRRMVSTESREVYKFMKMR